MNSIGIARTVEIFYERKNPKNVVLEVLGFKENSSKWKMANTAFDLFNQGLKIDAVESKIYTQCLSYDINSFVDDDEIEGDFGDHICSDMSQILWQLLDDPITKNYSVYELVFAMTDGEYPDSPQLSAVARFARANKNLAQEKFMEAVFNECDKKDAATKKTMISQFYKQ